MLVWNISGIYARIKKKWRAQMRDYTSNLNYIANYNPIFNKILGIDIDTGLKIFASEGLEIHMRNRGHQDCVQFLENLPDIISHPDYIGINPRERGKSVELVKKYSDNVQIGIKLDTSGEYLYVATVFQINTSKIERRLHSGRLKNYKLEIIRIRHRRRRLRKKRRKN